LDQNNPNPDQDCKAATASRPCYAEDARESNFEALLHKKGLIIRKIRGDGNCLFRSVAEQVYGDQEMHEEVRRRTMDYMEAERDHFSQFITEDFNDYIRRKRDLRVYGNHTEIQAMCEMYGRPIEVYSYSLDPINIFQGAYTTDSAPLRLAYHQHEHYNAIIDPNVASVGVGLGLPGHKPGAADKKLLDDALLESEREGIESAMYEQAVMDDVLRKTSYSGEDAEEAMLEAAFVASVQDNAAAEAALLAEVSAQSAREHVAVDPFDSDLERCLRASREEYFNSFRRF